MFKASSDRTGFAEPLHNPEDALIEWVSMPFFSYSNSGHSALVRVRAIKVLLSSFFHHDAAPQKREPVSNTGGAEYRYLSRTPKWNPTDMILVLFLCMA